MTRKLRELERLGLVETRNGGEGLEMRVSEGGCKAYAAMLTALYAAEADKRITDPDYLNSYEGRKVLRSAQERAYEASAKVQKAVQGGKLKETPSAKEVKEAMSAALTVVVAAAGEVKQSYAQKLMRIYFSLLAKEINPENVEYWLTGCRPETFGG